MRFETGHDNAMHREKQRVQAQSNREERRKKALALLDNPIATWEEKRAAWLELKHIMRF